MPRLCVEGLDLGEKTLNTAYLERAKDRVQNIPLMINMIAQRVKELNNGARPLLKPDSPHMTSMDLAIKEIAEGKLTAEIQHAAMDPEAKEENVISF